MFLNRIISIFKHLLGQSQQLALFLLRARNLVRCLLVAVVALSARMATASVAQTGDVTPADNPFTTDVYEGLPTSGNFVNPFELQTHQTYFEGRHTDGADPNVITDDTNINFSITIGKTSFGSVVIRGGSALRDQDLIIGDKATVNGNVRLGTGVLRITEFGSMYNNDPTILPAEVQNLSGGFSSQTPRSTTVGYDTWVGRYGTGTLDVSAGARAELQDSLLVGDNVGAVGNLTVDGFDSFLGNGGFAGAGTGTTSATDPHIAIIGRQGTGTMTVSAGATMASEAPPTLGGGSSQTGPTGAVLGSTPFSLTLGQAPDAGGSGTATVTGSGSKWTIGGSLQVGGFDIGLQNMTIGDLEGDNVIYSSQAGRGTLYVNDGGLVEVRNASGVSPTDTTTPLLLAIGHFGTVQLAGGTIRVGNANSTGNQGSTNQATPDSVQLINDGVITGSGRIETGVFRNRYFGEVRVNGGQYLVIDSSSQFQNTGGTTTPPEPLTNYGKINVLGTVDATASLEFVRAPADGTTPIRPFINITLPVSAIATGTFVGGQISAQNANLIFGSGLENHGLLAFTAGTNNVSGKVVNLFSGDTDEPDHDDDDALAQVLVSGPGTKAIFQNDLSFGAHAALNLVNGGNIVVQNQSSFALAGDLGIELSYSNPSLIDVAGNVGIGKGNSSLTVNVDADVLHSLKHGDAFKIISFGGVIGNVDVTTNLNGDPIADLTTAPMFSSIRTSPNIKADYGLDTVVEFSNQGVYVEFLNPLLVGGGAGAKAPDFNGDGKVDGADLAIWEAHVGITSGASVLEGDANGDGAVDGADFLVWQRNVGKPMPWAGAGAGSGSGAAVPEPASTAMLFCAGSLALVYNRRRRSR